ncbi:MAG TPA: hypothetical protein VF523_11035, partial [Burkholderiales bacterium]
MKIQDRDFFRQWQLSILVGLSWLARVAVAHSIAASVLYPIRCPRWPMESLFRIAPCPNAPLPDMRRRCWIRV